MKKQPFPNAHFGEVGKKHDWRKKLADVEEPDDDEELEETPKDVVRMLGFDPKEFSEKKK